MELTRWLILESEGPALHIMSSFDVEQDYMPGLRAAFEDIAFDDPRTFHALVIRPGGTVDLHRVYIGPTLNTIHERK